MDVRKGIEVKVSKMFRWIHKNGKSTPDKRYKGCKSQAKKNGARKKRKK
jgi:hypothetical protein